MRSFRALAATAWLVVAPVWAADIEYRLQPGDNPWRITERLLASPRYWPRLLHHNGLDEAASRRLAVGATLRIPEAWLATRPADVVVLAVHQDVRLRREGQAEQAVEAGAHLRAGDVLVTGASASASLRVEDGSRVLLRPGSEVGVLQAERTAGPGAVRLRLQLLRGALENAVRPVAPGGRFEINTPSGIGAVRGTEYRLAADGERTSSEVLDGRVQLANASGAVPLGAGEGSIVERGQAPQAAVALLPAPDLAALPALAERLPIDLPVSALPGAVAYRTQVAADAAFTQVLSDLVADAPRLRVLDVEDGDRFVRVRGIDARGLEGWSAQRPLRVHARPEAPLVLEPAPEAAIGQDQPVLRWTVVPTPGRQVHVQVARDAGFAELLVDERRPDLGELRMPVSLAPGRYHWRIAAVDPSRGEGPWGDAQGFERVLTPPVLEAPQAGAFPLVLRWQRLPGAAAYRVRLSKGGDVTLDRQVEVPQLVVDALPPGDHAVQVQAVGSDGRAGPWSTPQQFTVPPAGTRCPWWLLFLVPFWWV